MQMLSISVTDKAGGISISNLRKIFYYYFSTAPKMEPTYTYSGMWGSPLTGLGCGLPLSRVYARYRLALPFCLALIHILLDF